MSDDHYTVGKGKPPKDTQFPPGVSGFAGRRRSRLGPLPHDDVLGRLVGIVENGVPQRVSAEIAFLMRAFELASKKGGRIRRYVLKAIESGQKTEEQAKGWVVYHALLPELGDVAMAMRACGMAKLLHPTLPSAKLVVEPWLVNAALDRLDGRLLGETDQAVVVAATRRPHSVRWPDWWVVKPK